MAVPLDRGNAGAGTITLAIYVLPHTDLSTPAGEPLFATPGGPGAVGLDDYGLYPMQAQLRPHHDLVTVDPRGTGASGAIDCPDLQDGVANDSELQAAIAACGQQLGSGSDRYGAADRAMDMEAVRQALGYQLLDYYGGSYGSVDAQAYVVRYPEHVRALLLDSGFTVTDPAHVYAFGQGVPAALIHSIDLECARDLTCHAADPHPEATLTALIRRVRQTPVKGHPSDASASTVVVGEAAVANLLANANGPDLVAAAIALTNNDAQPLVDLTAKNSLSFPAGDDLSAFSDGANAAGFCNDQDFPYRRSDPPAIRRARLDAAFAALPDDAFAPLSKEAWAAFDHPDFCINWPAPGRFVPVVPSDATFPDVPTLILSGDVDRNVPTVLTKQLLSEFPRAGLVVVAGAGHTTMSASGSCVGTIGAEFLSTLKVGDTSCAATPG